MDNTNAVSIDFSQCITRREKIYRVFNEEMTALKRTVVSSEDAMSRVINLLKEQLQTNHKMIVVGSGASALVAKEMAGQATECGIPVMVFTNELANAQPVSFSKGTSEDEEGLSDYISLVINEGDVVIGISVSGRTGFVYDVLKKARNKLAHTVSITENKDSIISKYSNYVIKTTGKPEGPSSSKAQVTHLAVVHTIILILADELGVTKDDSIRYMQLEKLENKEMGDK